jgi:DNA-directed RNA polymerase specialized sigma24 family protein
VPNDNDLEVAEWQAIVRRDEDAFKRWLERIEITLRRSLRSFATVVDVEVVVQETAIRVWDLASTIVPDGRPAFLARWAATVARRKALNEVKRAQREVPLDESSDRFDTQSVQAGADPFLRARIHSCHERLPTALRRVIDMILADGGQRPGRECAAESRISHDAFRQNLARGRRALVNCLKEHGIDIREYLR